MMLRSDLRYQAIGIAPAILKALICEREREMVADLPFEVGQAMISWRNRLKDIVVVFEAIGAIRNCV